MKDRHSFSNVHGLLHVIHPASPSDTAEELCTFNAQKAYYRMVWEYLFAHKKREKKTPLGFTFFIPLHWLESVQTTYVPHISHSHNELIIDAITFFIDHSR